MVAYTIELTSHVEYKKVCMNDEIVIFLKVFHIIVAVSHLSFSNLQLPASLSILFLADLKQSMPDVDDGRQAGRLSLRLGYASGKHVFFTYKNSFSFAVFECTHEKIYYIKKETIPHMANTNVCRYSQCIAPKTPTT